MEFLGVDIGGSGMKAGLVDTITGQLISDRKKVLTPTPATPDAITEAFGELVAQFDTPEGIGCTFPGVIRQGATVATAVNLDPLWVGENAAERFSLRAGLPVTLVNDADAAAIAEGAFGAAKGTSGLVVVITLGTGIGSGLLHDGLLIPNTELGHLEIDGADAEASISARAKERSGDSFETWGTRLSRYLVHLEALLWPDLIVIGGGISRQFDEFKPFLSTRTPVVRAELKNTAGIAGAAHLASQRQS